MFPKTLWRLSVVFRLKPRNCRVYTPCRGAARYSTYPSLSCAFKEARKVVSICNLTAGLTSSRCFYLGNLPLMALTKRRSMADKSDPSRLDYPHVVIFAFIIRQFRNSRFIGPRVLYNFR